MSTTLSDRIDLRHRLTDNHVVPAVRDVTRLTQALAVSPSLVIMFNPSLDHIKETAAQVRAARRPAAGPRRHDGGHRQRRGRPALPGPQRRRRRCHHPHADDDSWRTRRGCWSRFAPFLIDSAALETVAKIVERNHPDIVEALPAPILAHLPAAISRGSAYRCWPGDSSAAGPTFAPRLLPGQPRFRLLLNPCGAQVNKMTQLSSIERSVALAQMAAQGVDILVIGGGHHRRGRRARRSARAAIAWAWWRRAISPAAPARKSTKLVHGGIRYLPQFDFELVHEALIERELLLHNAPFLVKPLGFVLPSTPKTSGPLGTPIVPPFGIGMTYLLPGWPARSTTCWPAGAACAATCTSAKPPR